jgi:hypothetical protein
MAGPIEAAAGLEATTEPVPADRGWALVWIDSREAIIARWHADGVEVERLQSDVPRHHRSTGHVRHDPRRRHGGGGVPQTAGETRRLEHLARFLDLVEERLQSAPSLLLLGPGTVHEKLAEQVRETDTRHRTAREVRSEQAPRMTRAQLVARLRSVSGVPVRRRTVGAYRWTEPSPTGTPGPRVGMPRRVAPKAPRSPAPRHDEPGGGG